MLKACSLTKYFFPPSCRGRGVAAWGEPCAGPGKPRLCPPTATGERFSRAAGQQLLVQEKDTTNGRHWGGEAGGRSLGQRRGCRSAAGKRGGGPGTRWHRTGGSWGLPGPSPAPAPCPWPLDSPPGPSSTRWAAAFDMLRGCPPAGGRANLSGPPWAHFGSAAGRQMLQAPFPQAGWWGAK